jgi:hypothetical protein
LLADEERKGRGRRERGEKDAVQGRDKERGGSRCGRWRASTATGEKSEHEPLVLSFGEENDRGKNEEVRARLASEVDWARGEEGEVGRLLRGRVGPERGREAQGVGVGFSLDFFFLKTDSKLILKTK